MVILDRIAHIRALVEHGAKVSTTISCNSQTGIEKIKVVIDPSVRIEPHHQQATFGILPMLEHAATVYRVADRGHKFSNGKSEVSFYIDYGRPPNMPKVVNDVDEVAELALRGLQSKIDVFLHEQALRADAPNDAVQVALEPSYIAFYNTDLPDTVVDETLINRARDSLRNFAQKYQQLAHSIDRPARQEVLPSLDNSHAYPPLIGSGARNALLNGTYVCIGTHCGRSAWQSDSGMLVYYSEQSVAPGWFCGYTLDPNYALAHHPSFMAFTPPAASWDCLLFGAHDEGFLFRTDRL